MRKSLLALVCAGLGCAGAGPYGHARSYVTSSDESSWAERATEPVYDDVRRMPDQHQNEVMSFFGVVTAVHRGRVGEPSRVAMQIRTHQERHLCEDESESSCRVTVNARDGGPFTGIVTLRTDDMDGENQVQVNSLLRVFGTLVQGEYDEQGGPVLQVQHYRHWPRGEYVTTANAGALRR